MPIVPVAAQSSWNPTLIVNTEPFMTIDDSDSTADLELRFGSTLNEKITYDRTNNRFRFSRQVLVSGDITATGSLSVKRQISGATLRVDGAADIWGTLSATGVIATKSNITINSDNGASDAVLTFGNQTAAQTLTYQNAPQRLRFSDDLSVLGSLSGSSLRVDGYAGIWGNLTASGSIDGSNLHARNQLQSSGALVVEGNTVLNGIQYTWPGTAAASSGQILQVNPATGILSWGNSVRFIHKSADEAVVSSTTLQNDDHFTLTIGANETWVVQFLLSADTNGTADYRLAIAGQAGATCVFTMGSTEQATVERTTDCDDVPTSMVVPGPAAGNFDLVSGFASYTQGNTSGSVTLQWAQNGSSVNPLTFYAGSYMMARRIQ